VIPFTLLVLATLPAGWRLLRARGWQDPAFVISMSGALSFLGVLVLVLLQKSVLLMYSHFSIWLVLPLAVSFVAPVDALVRRLDPLLDGVAYRVVAAQIVVSLVMLATLYGLYSAQLLLPWFVTTLLAAVVVAAIAVCVFTTQQAVMIAAVAFLLLPVAMQTFRADGYGGNFWGLDRSPWMVHQYALVKDAVAYIADRTQGRPLHFWISKAAYPLPRVGVFRSFARCAYDTNFPATLPDPTTTHWQGPLKAGALLVILTGPQERPQLGTPALNDKGLDFEMFASRDFVDGPAALGVHMGILKERR
jgi:hypothetical protein